MADQFFRETRRLVFGPLVLLVAATAVFPYFLGDAPNLLLLKLTAVPLYLLAGRAISMLCPLPDGNQLNWQRRSAGASRRAPIAQYETWMKLGRQASRAGYAPAVTGSRMANRAVT